MYVYIHIHSHISFRICYVAKKLYFVPFSKGWSSVIEHVLASIGPRANPQYQLINQLIKQSNTKYNKMR